MGTVSTETPKLQAEATKDGRWRVWCRFCVRWHYHGKVEGHRVAHCINPDSPYKATGYFLIAPAAKGPQPGKGGR